jgi:hypothetical protein
MAQYSQPNNARFAHSAASPWPVRAIISHWAGLGRPLNIAATSGCVKCCPSRHGKPDFDRARLLEIVLPTLKPSVRHMFYLLS